MRRIAFVWLSHWPTDRLIRHRAQGRPVRNNQACQTGLSPNAPRPDGSNAPLGLYQSAAGGQRLTALNEAARAIGLFRGQLLADARAQCPTLEAVEHDPAADRVALKALAGWAGRYTPWTAPSRGVNGEDGLILDVTGCAHLFGSERALLNDLSNRLQGFGLNARIALADTLGAAWALAHYAAADEPMLLPPGGQKAALLDLPVAALRLDSGVIEGLEAVGFKTIGDVIDLPRGPLTARFGTDPAHRLDQALGIDEEPVAPEAPLVPFRARRLLPEPIITHEAVLSVLDALASDLCTSLIDQGVGARRLDLHLFRADGACFSLPVATSRPCHRPDHLIRLFKDQLEIKAHEAAPGFGFDAVSLDVTQVETSSPTQLAIAASILRGREAGAASAQFTQSPQSPSKRKPPRADKRPHGVSPGFTVDMPIVQNDSIGHLIDTVGNRLGLSNVYTLEPGIGHLPERSMAVKSATKSGTSIKADSSDRSLKDDISSGAKPASPPANGSGLSRPLSLLPGPEPIEVLAEIPDGPPRRFQWRRASFDIARFEGPERIAPEWWRSARSTGDAPRPRVRDYYRVEDGEGRRFWLCRHGLYGAEPSEPKWYIHGFFA
ncbi:MAG: DNA polymerase Y family protein [Pseudomonadota bacterium]